MIAPAGFAEFCRAVVVDGYGPVVALFLVGLAGGLTHCAGMCGPFALGQAMARPTSMDRRERLRAAVLAPYHLGRATTYAGLGALAAGGTGLVARFSDLAAVAVPLLIVSAALVLVQAGERMLGGSALGRAVTRLAPRFTRRTSASGRYALGILLGFLPCGLVYAALAGAAATANPALGAAAMAAFAAGTAPALVVVAYAGHGLARSLGAPLRAIAVALLFINAGTIGLVAWTAAP